MVDPHEDGEVVLARFNRLIQELIKGDIARNCFRPWEIELLLDIQDCHLKEAARRDTLRRYQKSVQRHMGRGAAQPMLLSEYLGQLRARRQQPAALAPSAAIRRAV